jgi:hypothetical protein
MSDKFEDHLDGLDMERRRALLKLVRGAAFTVPLVSTFMIDGRRADAQVQKELYVSNMTGS